MAPKSFEFDEGLLQRVLADPAFRTLDAKAAAIGCSRTTLVRRLRGDGVVALPAAAPPDAAPYDLRGPVCPDRAQRLFQAVLLEMWRVALHLSFDKCTDYERAEARRWFGTTDFDLVCLFAGVDADAMLARFRAARARLSQLQGRTPDRRRTALERIAA